MSSDIGTTPIIADLKGRRVLVTGDCVVASELLLTALRGSSSRVYWPEVRLMYSHAEG